MSKFFAIFLVIALAIYDASSLYGRAGHQHAYQRAASSQSALNDFIALPKAVKDAATTTDKPCTGFNSTEITLSPLSNIGTTLLLLKKPTDFLPDEKVTYQVVQSPADDSDDDSGHPPFTVNATNYLNVATDRLLDKVDLGKYYDMPSQIVINASSSSMACTMNFTLRFFDASFVYEPDWEANPVLESGYFFAIDCPGPSQALGRVGDENRNDIYHIKYAIESDNSPESKITQKLFTVDSTSGKVTTSKDTTVTTDKQLRNTTKKFRISASAPDHHAVYAIVNVVFGKCDKAINPTADFDTFQRRFVVKCAASGDIIGQLPRGIKTQNFASYVMYPTERDFSVTADGQIRVRDVDLKKVENYTLSVSASTSNGQVTVYTLTIEVQRCDTKQIFSDVSTTAEDEDKKPAQQYLSGTLPKLATFDLPCPAANQVIVDLQKLSLFVQELSKFIERQGNPVYFNTNASNFVQITPDMRLFWLHDIPAYRMLANLAVTISAQAAGETASTDLGYIQLRGNSPQQSQQSKCSLNAKRRSQFQQTINLQCPAKGENVAYISTASLPAGIRRSTFTFSLGKSEYFGVEPTSGIIFVKKTVPDGLELSTALSIVVVGQSFSESVFGERVYDGLLYVHISCPADALFSDPLSEDSMGAIKCESFDFRSSNLPIGVAVRGGSSLNSDFVAQVFAEVTGLESNGSKPPFSWSIEESKKYPSGYKIDPYSGRIFQVNVHPQLTVMVKATSTVKPALHCTLQVKPKIVESSQLVKAKATSGAYGLVNRQPPRFLSKDITLSRTSSSCKQVQRSTVFPLATGFYLGRVVAFDPDDGLAGAINYTLCPPKSDVVQSCAETLRVDISAADSFNGKPQQLYLQINSWTGNVFVARAQQVLDQEPIAFRVRASNTGQRRMFSPRGAAAATRNFEFLGLPASQSTDTAAVTLDLRCVSAK